MRRFILLSVLMSLFLISCGGEDAFAGKAYKLRAEQGLKEIRNALVGYKINSGRFPKEENWTKELMPYFKKERSPEPKWVTKNKMLVMSAKNNISQVKGIMKELKRKIYYADTTLQSQIMEFLGPIDSALTLAEYEVSEARRYHYRDIGSELKGLYDFTSNLKISEEKDKILKRMETQNKELSEEVEELKYEMLGEDSTLNKAVENATKVINGVIETSLLSAQGEETSLPESLGVHSDVIEELTSRLNPKKDTLLIKNLRSLDEKLTYYAQGKDNIEFLYYLNDLKKKLPASMSLFSSYYNKGRATVIEANKTLNGYSALQNLRSLVHFYADQNDSMPKGNLYVVFQEDEDMKEIRKVLSSDPYIYIENNGYRLEANALDEKQMPLVLKVEFINNYDEIVKQSFTSGPFYYTDDSGSTFFVVVKAGDKHQTIITGRPKLKEVK